MLTKTAAAFYIHVCQIQILRKLQHLQPYTETNLDCSYRFCSLLHSMVYHECVYQQYKAAYRTQLRQ